MPTAAPRPELPLEKLAPQAMANGWHSLLLTESIGWEDLPTYAEALAPRIGARIGKRLDGPDVRMVALRIDALGYWLVFDDFPLGVTLEPQSKHASERIPQLFEELQGLP